MFQHCFTLILLKCNIHTKLAYLLNEFIKQRGTKSGPFPKYKWADCYPARIWARKRTEPNTNSLFHPKFHTSLCLVRTNLCLHLNSQVLESCAVHLHHQVLNTHPSLFLFFFEPFYFLGDCNNKWYLSDKFMYVCVIYNKLVLYVCVNLCSFLLVSE